MRGVSAHGGGICLGGCLVHPPVNRMTGRCKNITFPQLLLPVADLRGGARDAHPPGGPNSLNFNQLLGKFGKIICWRPPPGELAPPPRGNPGSATGYGR